MQAGGAALPGSRPEVARVRHDLLTPINGIIGYAGILLEDAADLGRTEMLAPLDEIRSGARELADVIRRVLGLHVQPAALEAALSAVRQACLGPARGLVASTCWLMEEVAPPDDAALVRDLEQLAQAARALAALLDPLPDTGGDGPS
jgi:signal transduction histidine kinase